MEFFNKILGRTDDMNTTFDSENNVSLNASLPKHGISTDKLDVPVQDSENTLNVSDLARDLNNKLILGTPRQDSTTKFNTNKWASPSRSANNSLLSGSGNNSLLSTSGNFSPTSDSSFVTARDSLTSNVYSPGAIEATEIETILLDKTIDVSSDSNDSLNLSLDASIIPKVQRRSEKKSEGDDFEIVDFDCDKEDVKVKPTQQQSQDSSEGTEPTEANDYIDSSIVSQDIYYLSAEESISEEGTSRYASLENVYNTVIHNSHVDNCEVSVVGINDLTQGAEVSVVGLNNITRATDVSVLGPNDITQSDFSVQSLSTLPDESNVDQFIEEISGTEPAKEQLLEKSIEVEDSESLNSSNRTLNESIVNNTTCSLDTNSPNPLVVEPVEVEIISDVQENNLEQLEKHISVINLNSEKSVEEIRAESLCKSFTVTTEPDPTGAAKLDSNIQDIVANTVECTQDASVTLDESKSDTVVSAETQPIETATENSNVIPEPTLNPSEQEDNNQTEESENKSELVADVIENVITEVKEKSAEKVVELSSVEKCQDDSKVLASDVQEKESIQQPAQSNSSSEIQCDEPLDLSIDLHEPIQESVEQSLAPVEEITKSADALNKISGKNNTALIVSQEPRESSVENPCEKTENQEPIESVTEPIGKDISVSKPQETPKDTSAAIESNINTTTIELEPVAENSTLEKQPVEKSNLKVTKATNPLEIITFQAQDQVSDTETRTFAVKNLDKTEALPSVVQEPVNTDFEKLQSLVENQTKSTDPQETKATEQVSEPQVQVPVIENAEEIAHLVVEVQETVKTDLGEPAIVPSESSLESVKENVEKTESSPLSVEEVVNSEVKSKREKKDSEQEQNILENPPVPESLLNQIHNKETKPKDLSVSKPQETPKDTSAAIESNINTTTTELEPVTENSTLEKQPVIKSTNPQEIITVQAQEQVSDTETFAVKNLDKTEALPSVAQEPVNTDLEKLESLVDNQTKSTDSQETKAKEQVSEPQVQAPVIENAEEIAHLAVEIQETIKTDLGEPAIVPSESLLEPFKENVEKIESSPLSVDEVVNSEVQSKREKKDTEQEQNIPENPPVPESLLNQTEHKETKPKALLSKAQETPKDTPAPIEIVEGDKPAKPNPETDNKPESTSLEVEKSNQTVEKSNEEVTVLVGSSAKTTNQENPSTTQSTAVETPSVQCENPISLAQDVEKPETASQKRKSFPLEANSAHNDSLGEFELIESQLSSDQAEEERRLSERIAENPAEVSSELLENVIPDGFMEDENINKSEAGPDTAEISREEFQSSDEWFKDPNSFDFLEQVSNKARIAESELRKQSLYVKFDPFLKSPVRSLAPQNNIMEEESLNDSKPISELNDSVANMSTNGDNTNGESLNVSSVPSQISNVSSQPDASGDACSSTGAEKDKLIEKLKKENAMLQNMLNDYENTITQCVNQREADKKQFEKYKKELEREKEEAQLHLRNSEIAFNDVHQKYERSKAIIEGMKANEDGLKARQAELEEELKKQLNKYEVLKNHAISQLEKANQDLELRMKTNEVEQAKLKAMLKKSEMHITSLQESLARKTQENGELTSICDDLLSKLGVNE
ncbi:hypothetical protein WDU94_015025 [Cyamophila willieti]